MKRKNGSPFLLLLMLLMIAVTVYNFVTILNGTDTRKIDYPALLQMIEKDEVSAVSIQGSNLKGLKRLSGVAASSFPTSYDFETTIGGDFLLTARQLTAAKTGKALDEVSVADLPFTVAYRVQETNWLLEFLPDIIFICFAVFLVFYMMRMQGGGQGMMNFGKARTQRHDASRNKITFADVAGADEEKEELQEMVDFLRNPKAYSSVGARIPKGVLLVGPPGTGKTLLAKAVAGEANVPFFSISGSDFVEMFVGVGASRVRDLFDQAKHAAPAIVFIDEIDAVGRRRGAGLGGGHDEREQTLNQLLVEMDGFEGNTGVIVMAATNRRDILDPALLRPGRFDRQVSVNYPDMEGRVAVLKVHSKGKPLAADVDLENIARRVPYSSGAELENIMNEAAILAARDRKTVITHQNLVDAIDRVQMGPEKKSHKVNEKDRRMVAVHETGHALVGHLLPGADDIHLITIVPRGQSAGHTLSLPAEEHDNMSRTQLLDTICMCLGGHAAEEVVIGEIYTGSSSDLKRATELCRRMVTEFGMSDLGTAYFGNDQEVFVGNSFGQSREYSEQIAAEIDQEVRKLMEMCYNRAKELIRGHMESMTAVVDALLAQSTVTRSEFISLMETGKLPEKTAEESSAPAETITEEEFAKAPSGDEPSEETPYDEKA